MSDLGGEWAAVQERLAGLGPRDLGPGEAVVAADLALLDAAEADLDAAQVVLARMDDGSDGTCEICGGPIDPEAIAADPLARACAAH